MIYSPDKQLTLHPMPLVLSTYFVTHVEPALTEEGCLLLQQFAARQTAEGGRLGGGESHWVIVKDELVTSHVSGGHHHPPHTRSGLHQPGVAGGAILVVKCQANKKLILTLVLWICSCLSQ